MIQNKQREKYLNILYLINFAANSGYSLVIPLYPPLAKKNGLSETQVGYIFTLYPLGSFFVSILLGKTMNRHNMKNIMVLGLVLQIIGMLGFGLLKFSSNYKAFIISSAVFRLANGIGGTLCFTPTYSLAAYLYPEQLNYVLSRMEIVSGVSLFSGPFFGGIFQAIGKYTPVGGYTLPFLVLSSIYVAIIPLLWYNLHIEDFLITDDKITSRRSLIDADGRLNYTELFKIKGIMQTYISYTTLFISFMGIKTYQAIYLQDQYNLSEVSSTLLFVLNTIFYGVSAAFVGQLHFQKTKQLFFYGSIIACVACFLYGPDTRLIFLPHSIWFVMIADILNGIGMGIMSALIVTEFVSIIKNVYPEKDDEANDFASGIQVLYSALFISSWSIGELIGPLIGGYLVEMFYFERSASLLGCILIMSSAFYWHYMRSIIPISSLKLKLIEMDYVTRSKFHSLNDTYV